MILSREQQRWRINVFAATWMSYAGYYFCRKAFGIVKVPLKALLEVDDFSLAHIWTAYLVAYMCGQFLSGWLGTRYTCRRLLLGGMAITLVCNLGFGAVVHLGPDAYWPFFGLMILNGFAQSTGWPGNIGTLAHWFRRDERGGLLGLWATCYQLGSVAAKAFAGFMYVWAGLSWSFWGASCVLFPVWIFVYLRQRDRPETVGLEPIVPDPPPTEENPEGDDARWPATVIRTLLVMGAAYFSFKFLRYALDSWTATVLTERFGLDADTAAYVSVIFDVCGFLGVIAAGYATDRFFASRRALVAFVMAVGMVGAALFLQTTGVTSVVLFAVGLGLLGFTLFGPDSLLSGVGAIDVGSKRKAVLAAGIVNGMGSAGPVIQEEVIGYLKTYHSLDAVFLLLVFVAFIGAIGTGILWWWGRRGLSRF
jgi:OPA family glycerol-3-phosphate transporter-like MFS transporter